MIDLEAAIGIAFLILWIFCIFDVIATDNAMMRNLPKPLWLIIVIILPDVGSIAWLILGRPRGARLLPGSTETRPKPRRQISSASSPRAMANEDSPEFMRNVEQRRLLKWEEDLKRREEELRRREHGDDPPTHA